MYGPWLARAFGAFAHWPRERESNEKKEAHGVQERDFIDFYCVCDRLKRAPISVSFGPHSTHLHIRRMLIQIALLHRFFNKVVGALVKLTMKLSPAPASVRHHRSCRNNYVTVAGASKADTIRSTTETEGEKKNRLKKHSLEGVM